MFGDYEGRVKDDELSLFDLNTGGRTNVIALIVLLEQVVERQLDEEILNKILDTCTGKSLKEINKVKEDNVIIRLGLMYYRKYGKTINWSDFFHSIILNT